MKSLKFIITVLCVFTLFLNLSIAQSYDSADLIDKGIKLHDEGKFEEAIELYNKVNINDTNYAMARYEIALSLASLEKNDEAIIILNELLAIDSLAISEVITNLATAYDVSGQPEKAIETYKKGIKLFPMNYANYFNIGVTYYQQEQYDDAIEAFQESIKRNFYHVGSHYHLGSIMYEQGRRIPAILALNMTALLENDTERGINAINLLQNIANGSAEMPDNTPTEDQIFSEVDEIIKSQVALNKKYKSVLKKIEDPYSKQFQMLCEQISYIEGNTNFFNHYYVPYLKRLVEDEHILEHLLFIYRTFDHKKLQKILAKNANEVNEYIEWAEVEIDNIKADFLLGEKILHSTYYDNSTRIIYLGSIEEVNNEMTWVGPLNVYFYDGSLQVKAQFDAHGKKTGKWIWFHENGKIKETNEYVEGLINGEGITYFENGQKKEHNFYKNDTLMNGKEYNEVGCLTFSLAYDDHGNGEGNSYHNTGGLKHHYTLKNRLIDSVVTQYYPTGEIQDITTWNKGERNGETTGYNRNGTIQNHGRYINNKIVGELRNYNSEGQLTYITNYNDSSLIHGQRTELYKNGVPSLIEQYTEGKLNGTILSYDIDSVKHYEIEYKDGNIQSYKYYDKNGRIISQERKRGSTIEFKPYHPNGQAYASGKFVRNKKEGPWKYYNTNGTIDLLYNYKNDTLEGEYISYFQDGSTYFQGNYKKGKLHGEYKKHYRNGKLSEKGYYRNGKIDGIVEEYYKDGTLSATSFMAMGKQLGEKVDYRVDGTKEVSTYYHKLGYIYKYVQYDTNGNVFNTIDVPLGTGEVKLLHLDSTIRFEGVMDKNYFVDTIRWTTPFGFEYNTYCNKAGKNEGNNKRYYQTGELLSSGQKMNNLYVGDFYQYFKNGKIMKHIKYDQDGDIQDTLTEFHNNGQIKSTSPYWNNDLEGYKHLYDEKGNLMIRILYDDGHRISYSYLNPDGTFHKEIKIQKGTGYIKAYYQNGNISFEGNIKNGYDEGELKKYYFEGALKELSNNAKGNFNGKRTLYYPDGSIKKTLEYLDGDLHGQVIFYYKNGNKKYIKSYILDEAHGEFLFYDSEGNVSKKENYLYDYLISIEK